MNEILVFTPKEKGIVLPKGATALDFAYKIHSWIGQHAVHARINGQLMSVKTMLNYGDCVEIVANENSRPDADWIDYVKTNSAKRHLRSYIQSVLDNEYKRCPHCHPLPGDKVIGFKADDGTITLHKHNCSTAMVLNQGKSMLAIEFYEDEHFLYPVRVEVVRRVDKHHFWINELGDDIIEKLKLWNSRKSVSVTINTRTIDRIVLSTIDFDVHSANELDSIIKSISTFKGVDEVHIVEIE